MKRLLAFLMSLLLLIGCEEVQPAQEAMITLDSEQTGNYIISSDGGSFDVSFTSVLDWTAGIVYESGGEGWASLNKTSGKGGYDIARLKVTVQNNQNAENRSARLVIESEDKSVKITFTQDGFVEQGEEPVFRLSDKEAEIGAEGGRIQVIVEFNVDYDYEISADWIKEVTTKSVDSKVHTFEIQANTSESARTGMILFCGNYTCLSFSVIQAAAEAKPYLEIDKESVMIGADGASEPAVVNVTSNTGWTVSTDASWLTVSPKSGDGNGSFSIVADVNDRAESRSASVMVSSSDGTISRSLVVLQDSGQVIFELLNNSADVDAEGGIVSVQLKSNIEYDYTVTADWVREVSTRSENVFEHTFEVLENTETKDRTAVISFCGNDTCLPFTINQKGYQSMYRLEVDVKDISVAASGTEAPYVVNVQSDTDWNVGCVASWCTIDPSSGTNDGSFLISVAENTSSEPRITTVVVSVADGSLVRKIGVIQAPKSSDSGDDSWKNHDFIHKSLALRFTADWCGYCPMMATAMAKAQEQIPDKLEVISVHGGGSGLASEASNALTNYYGIGSFPTGYVDGLVQIVNYDILTTTANIVAAVKQTEEKYDTYTGVSWKSSVSGNQIILNLSAYIKKAGSYKITALLVEDDIVGYQADYNNGSSNDYVHIGVLRAAFSDVECESFEITEDFQKKDFAYSVDVPSGSDVNNMRIVVYIQRQDGKYYVDNTASASVGKDRSLALTSGNWGSGNEGIVPGDDITF